MPARAKAPKSPFATTQEVSAAAGEVHRDTLRRWCKMDLLPEPTIIGRGRAGVHGGSAGGAVDRPAWTRQMVELGYTLVEIAEQVKAGQAPAAVVEASGPETADEPGD